MRPIGRRRGANLRWDGLDRRVGYRPKRVAALTAPFGP